MTVTSRAFDHVLIIMFENQYRTYVMQNEYMRGLAAQGIDMANYFGVMHPSQTNYIASIAGELCNVTGDYPPKSLLPQRAIVDLIEESPNRLSWKAYMDSYIPQNTPWTEQLTPKDEYPYVIKHNPFSSFASIVRSEARWNRIVDESQLWKDLLNGALPEYSWFTPNMWNDGHYLDGTKVESKPRAPGLVDQLAVWLEGFFGALRFPARDSHLPPGTLVVVTFDEADFEADYDVHKKYTYDGPNQIYTVLLGDTVRPGTEEEGYNHYSLLKTIEKNFGLGSLEKNDAEANWFRFLWGDRFGWSRPVETPIRTYGDITAAEYQGLLYVVYEDEDGMLRSQTFDGTRWSGAAPVGHAAGGALAVAQSEDTLVLVVVGAAEHADAVTYDAANGWSPVSQRIVDEPVGTIGLAPYGRNGDLMLAWPTLDGSLASIRYHAGTWGNAEPIPDHRSGDGPITLAALGSSLYLIHKVPGTDYMDVVSHNTAPFNAVTIPPGKYGGPYDDTTVGAWSPSAFPVAHFAHGPDPRTPGEEEPVRQRYRAGNRLVAATLDGVIHLAHPGAASPSVFTETFSISGVMTPKNPVSYNASDRRTTSNGYGTLAEAGWSRQMAVNGMNNCAGGGAMAMARLGSAVVLLSQPDEEGALHVCIGEYHGEYHEDTKD